LRLSLGSVCLALGGLLAGSLAVSALGGRQSDRWERGFATALRGGAVALALFALTALGALPAIAPRGTWLLQLAGLLILVALALALGRETSEGRRLALRVAMIALALAGSWPMILAARPGAGPLGVAGDVLAVWSIAMWLGSLPVRAVMATSLGGAARTTRRPSAPAGGAFRASASFFSASAPLPADGERGRSREPRPGWWGPGMAASSSPRGRWSSWRS
jgi:hypothetical protein